MYPPLNLRTLKLATLVPLVFLIGQALAADIKGQVMGGGAPIAQSTVTLWAASAGAPKQLAQTKTDNDGKFAIARHRALRTRVSTS